MHTVARLTEDGVHRVLNGVTGMTFIVDKFTPGGSLGQVAHVRDYRYPGDHRPFQIWSIAAPGYELLPADNSGHGFSQEDIWHEQRALGCSEEQAIRSLTEAESCIND